MKKLLLFLILAVIGLNSPAVAQKITLIYTGKTWGEVAPCHT
ncbi:hypothetical protein HNQ76_000790 [Thermosulfuriphilus ammonigenes]|nr:hypothetical protein [Thermosulfuriphilus ammonigenes]MBA2848444.1 hypothetical protein [Thermosulfuriphilus ammonigenes]